MMFELESPYKLHRLERALEFFENIENHLDSKVIEKNPQSSRKLQRFVREFIFYIQNDETCSSLSHYNNRLITIEISRDVLSSEQIIEQEKRKYQQIKTGLDEVINKTNNNITVIYRIFHKLKSKTESKICEFSKLAANLLDQLEYTDLSSNINIDIVDIPLCKVIIPSPVWKVFKGALWGGVIGALLSYSKYKEEERKNVGNYIKDVKKAIEKCDSIFKKLYEINLYLVQVVSILICQYTEFKKYVSILREINEMNKDERKNLENSKIELVGNGRAMVDLLVSMFTTPIFVIENKEEKLITDKDGLYIINDNYRKKFINN
ncbi:hypothetical protein [Actinobacillus delphinicola]|uniref:Uncharacterized protein n=1 Tax=Actinobacillus delphinicola TaxID=51161 RepID=A0A448TSU3_9PAST|nr:hypothetical protein [Actinobacillus delphinicola]VEJ08848.1 Uncharacterised protein [Actinobacillus delphinicola]